MTYSSDRYTSLFIELHPRRIVHAAVTRSPSDAWTVQQLREATPWGKGPKYLIRDRDSKYGGCLSTFATSSGIKELKTPFQALQANAHCERFIGTLKRKCLDHMLILHRAQLHRPVTEFVGYYNHSRPHQGIGQRIPARFDEEHHPQSGRIASVPVLNGLHHSYTRVAIWICHLLNCASTTAKRQQQLAGKVELRWLARSGCQKLSLVRLFRSVLVANQRCCR